MGVVEHEDKEDVERAPVCDEPYLSPLLNLEYHIDESHNKMEKQDVY